MNKKTSAESWKSKGFGDLLHRYDFESALKGFDKAIELDPNLVEAWRGKGDALHFLGRREDALAAYEETVKLDPNKKEVWRGQGDALYSLGRREDALVAYDTLIELTQYVCP